MRTLLLSALGVVALIAATHASAGAYDRISHDSDGFDRYSREPESSEERLERRENIRFENRRNHESTWSSENDKGRYYSPSYNRLMDQSNQRRYQRGN